MFLRKQKLIQTGTKSKIQNKISIPKTVDAQ